MNLIKRLLGLKDVIVVGNMHVSTLKNQFKDSFGTEIILYKTTNTGKGSRRAEDNSTLASICADGKKVKQITIKKANTVGEIENQFKDEMGIGVQIMMPDGKRFAPNDVKLKDVASLE